jgi:hypothetical protein
MASALAVDSSLRLTWVQTVPYVTLFIFSSCAVCVRAITVFWSGLHLSGKVVQKFSPDPDFCFVLQRIKSEIVEEYEKNKRDTAYQEARHNFQYLHEKLAHLKQLVHDYDTAQR